MEALRKDIMQKVVYKTIPKKYLDGDTEFHINPCENLIIGGPIGDAGLTVSKIPIEDGEPMEEEHSLAKITPRWTEAQLMQRSEGERSGTAQKESL